MSRFSPLMLGGGCFSLLACWLRAGLCHCSVVVLVVFVVFVVFCLMVGVYPSAVFGVNDPEQELPLPQTPASPLLIIRIGVLAYQGDAVAEKTWGPTAAYLNENIPGYHVSITPLTLETVTEATERKQIDFLLTSPASTVALEAQHGVTRIATLRRERLGFTSTRYGAVIFTRSDREDVQILSDLIGKQFMAVHQNSFDGWWMALRELKDVGIIPTRDFSSLTFTNYPHDQVVSAVLAGRADAGTVRSDLLEQMVETNQLDLSQLKILNPQTVEGFPFLLSTRLYPEYAISTLAHVDDSLGHDVAAALLNIVPTDAVAQAAGIAGWTVPKDYREVDALMRVLKVGHYEHFGEVSPREVSTQYAREILFLVCAVLMLILLCCIAVSFNRKLTRSQHALSEQMQQRERAQNELQQTVDRLHRLHTITAGLGTKLEHEVTRVLRETCSLLQMEGGQVNAFDIATGVIHTAFHYCQDDSLSISTTDRAITDSAESIAYARNEPYVRLDLRNTADTEGSHYPSGGGYISVPLWIGEAKYGTLCFFSDKPLSSYAVERDKDLILLISRWIGIAIERNKLMQREKADQLAHAARVAREAFVANMSHEMKTPLTAIVGYTERLMHEVVTESAREQLLDVILESAQTVTQLIDDVLDLSSIDHNQFDVDKAPVELMPFLREIRQLLYAQAKQKGLTFDFDCQYPLPAIFLTDAFVLKKTLTHLGKNAIKFTDSGSVLLIISYCSENHVLQIDVLDTGIGIDAKACDRIFEPFSQLHTGSSRAYGGVGLGLYLVKQYLGQLNGQVEVSSQLGRGSQFSVTLPNVVSSGKTIEWIHEAPPAEKAEAWERPLPVRTVAEEEPDNSIMVKPMAKPMAKAIVKSRSKVAPQCLGAVLVAEDNAVNQKIIERHLTRMGLDVKIVENGLQAVESCEIIDFDLVLMDIQMPVMDGVAAAKKIKVNGNAPPIIAITANTLKEDLETYRAVGIDKVIRKPINAESFYETVAPFLKGQQ